MKRNTIASVVGLLAVLGGIVLAGAPAQAASSRVSCGQTVVRDIALQRDLECAASGLVVGADGVDINLDGHTIIGSAISTSVGVDIGSHIGTTIHGGTVRGFATGAYLGGARNTDISRMTFVNSVVMAVQLAEGRHNTIRNTRVSHDFGDPNYAGILLYHSDSNLITMNVLTHNGDGISLDGASHNTIAGNTSSDSGVGVVLVDNSDSNTITANHTDRNMDSGVLLDRHADSNRIDFNEAAGNGFGGVVVGASDHNTVLDNMTDHNPGSGVVVTDNARATLVEGNHASSNGGTPPGCTPQCPLLNDGIHVDAPTTTLRSNVADSNADLGIDAVHGVIDGGPNRGHSNGNPLQCTVVICRG